MCLQVKELQVLESVLGCEIRTVKGLILNNAANLLTCKCKIANSVIHGCIVRLAKIACRMQALALPHPASKKAYGSAHICSHLEGFRC